MRALVLAFFLVGCGVVGCGVGGGDPVSCRTYGVGCNPTAETACERDFTCRMRRAPDGSGDCDGYYRLSDECLACMETATCEAVDAPCKGCPTRSLAACKAACGY